MFYVVVSALTLLFLKLDGDTSDWSSLDTSHQVSDVSSDLVSEWLASDDGNLVTDALVVMEVIGHASVVLLDEDTGSLLDGLGTNTTHV